MIAAVPELLVEDLEKDPQDRVASADAVGLAVDVEEDNVDIGGGSALDVAGQHGVLDLAVEELDGASDLSVSRDRAVLQEVGEDLQEVGFARSEEAGDPHPDFAGDVRVSPVVDRFQVGADELSEMNVQLLGDDVLVELLPDGLAVGLIHLDDAVDGTVYLLGKEFLDQHALAPSPLA